MKKITIKKNRHRPSIFSNLSFPFSVKTDRVYTFSGYYKFTDSCIYKFDDDYRGVNKLFGFSIGFHHHNSFRFGWRPSRDLEKIEILGYEYKNKERQPYINITEIIPDCTYFFQLRYIPNMCSIEYSIYDIENSKSYKRESLFYQRKCKLGYKLGMYFGGIYKAPHDIIIYRSL